MAPQHVPRDLVWPNSGYEELALKKKMNLPTSFSQLTPSNPSTQSQRYAVPSVTHVPPFLHGLDLQGSGGG